MPGSSYIAETLSRGRKQQQASKTRQVCTLAEGLQEAGNTASVQRPLVFYGGGIRFQEENQADPGTCLVDKGVRWVTDDFRTTHKMNHEGDRLEGGPG